MAILVLVCIVMWGNFLLFSASVKEQETRWNPLIDGFLAFQSLTLFLPTFGCAWGAELLFYSKIVSNSPNHYVFELNSDSPLSDCKNSLRMDLGELFTTDTASRVRGLVYVPICSRVAFRINFWGHRPLILPRTHPAFFVTWIVP